MGKYNDGDWLEFPKAKKFNPDKIQERVLIEEKLDGERLALWNFHAYGRRESSVTFRRENKWDLMPGHIQELATDIPVEGEIFVPGGTSSEVKTALINTPEKIDFVAFRLATELVLPHVHRSNLQALGFKVPKLLEQFSSGCKPEDPYSDLDCVHGFLESYARRNKLEGWILKEYDYDNVWWKYKLEETVDLIVTGIQSGRGKYTGQCGALICSLWNPIRKIGEDQFIEVAKVSGMTDLERAAISHKDIGRVVEVRYQCIAAKGRLRHPRFVRWRDDKPANECLLPERINNA